MRSLRQLLRDESGIALVLAIGILSVLTVSGTAAVFYSTSNARNADYSNSEAKAYGLAEAGIAQGLSILSHTPNNPMTPTLLSTTTITMEGGTATFSGTLSGSIWTITSTGNVANPTGGTANATRTITSRAQVVGVIPGGYPTAWSRIFHNDTGSCLTIGTVTIPSPVASRGDLCLKNGARIEGSATTVEVGDDVTLAAGTSIGLPGTPIATADIADGCSYGGRPPHKPCSAADRVYANTITTNPQNLTMPTVDMPHWYQNAKPGPKQNCTTGSFPGGFDNNSTYDASRSGSAEITPKTQSYTCQVKDAGGNLLGEMSWNHLTHVMKIHGTIFVDGDIRFDDDGELVNYQGRAIIYAAGDIEYDEVVCAGGDGTNNCHAGNMSNWDPEQNMMIILSGGWSEYDQGATWPRRPAAFQGVMYAKDKCVVHQDFRSSGPMVCGKVEFPFNEHWPTFYPWPPLQSLIGGMMYGNPATSPEHQVVVLEQAG